MEKEYLSRHLNVPFIIVNKGGKKAYLCENGVLITDEEYKKGIDVVSEYETRSKGKEIYDYDYAKNTGILKIKKAPNQMDNQIKDSSKTVLEVFETEREIQNKEDKRREVFVEDDRPSVENGSLGKEMVSWSNSKSVLIISTLLAFTSAISMYISTLHTATYLYDYVDVFSAWLMSASVTAYNSTAFEVSVMFHTVKRNFIAFVFMSLWFMVTLFSMATTVSVFYDRFNFTETQIAQDNKELDSFKYSLELLQKKESDLRRAIALKEKDIEYRQEREFATTAVRIELNKLENDLQKNLSEQQSLLASKPEIQSSVVQRKESLFTFLGRIFGLEGGILEFIMSTLSAIFVNLISPLSLSAVIELSKKKIDKLN